MRSRELTFIGGTCTVVLGTWLAFAAFMFDWDVTDLMAFVTPRKPRPAASVLRKPLSEEPAVGGRSAAR